MAQAVLQNDDSAKGTTLYVAFELSAKQWKLAFSAGGVKHREVTVSAGDMTALRSATELARTKFLLGKAGRVVSCYEAGREGFWLHRALSAEGVENVVVDSSSISVDRRARRAKTDRLDVLKLLAMLVRHEGGEQDVWSVVRVPTVEQEDARRLNREIDRLKQERTAHRNRIRALLALHGLALPTGAGDELSEVLDALKTPGGSRLSSRLKGELLREYERLALVEKHLKVLEQQREKALESKPEERQSSESKAARLMTLKAIGINGSWTLAHEVFWRQFENRRQLAGAIGLTPTPYQSGASARDQGISKSGSPRVRRLLIELSWLWLRYQPDSKLARWYQERFGGGQGRMRRVGIVALARRLLIALWRFVEAGVVPDGALLKAAA